MALLDDLLHGIGGAAQAVGNAVVNTPLSNFVPGLPHNLPPSPQAPTIGNTVVPFIQNRVVQPFEDFVKNAPPFIPGMGGLQAINTLQTGQQPNPLKGIMGGAQTIGNIMAPQITAGFAGFDAAKGMINNARTGQNPLLGLTQGFSGQNAPGIGTTLLGQGPLASSLNAGEMVAPFLMGGINTAQEGIAAHAATQFNKPMAAQDIEDSIQAIDRHVFKGSDINYATTQGIKDEQFMRQMAGDYINKQFGKTAPIEDVRQELLNRIRVDQNKPAIKLGLTSEQPATPGNPEPLPFGNEGLQAPTEPVKPTIADAPTANVILSPKAPPSEPAVDLKTAAYNARADMYANQKMVFERAKVAQQAVKDGIKGTGDTALFRQVIEHPENLETALQEAKNPTKFLQAVKAFQDYTDAIHKALTESGSKTGFLENYYPHIFDLSEPGKAEQLQQIAQAKAKNFSGFYNRERVFDDLNQAQEAGFLPKNSKIEQDIADHAQAVAKEVGANTLTQSLKKNVGSHVYSTDYGEAPPANFTQSKIPGAKGLYVSDALNQHLKDLEPVDLGKAAKTMDWLSNRFKSVKLAGGGFHILNTGMQYFATHASYLDNPQALSVIDDFLSPSHMAETRAAAIADGTMNDLLKSTVTLGSKQDFGEEGGLLSKINEKNPFEWLQKATFQRLEDSFKIRTFQMLRERGLINTSTPEGLAQAREYGQQINNLFGGMNRAVGDSVFKNKISQFLARQGFLAPDYQEARVRNMVSAMKGLNPMGSGANHFALRSFIGKILLTAGLAEAGRRLVTGKFSQNLKDVVQNDILNPNFPSPSQNNGKKQDVALPGNTLTDMGRIATQGPEHFLISHLGAGVSNAMQYLSNQNYYGAPLSATNNPLEKAKGLAMDNLPIPVVQAQKVISGKESPQNAVINVLGGRVSTDPNDPSVVYAKTRQNILQTQPQSIQDAYATLGNLKKMDPNDPVRKATEAMLFKEYPALYSVNQQLAYASANGDENNVDPLYRKGNEQIAQKYETYNTLPPKSAEASQYYKDNADLGAFEQQRADWFKAHPLPATTTASQFQYQPGPTPNPYVLQQMAAKNWNDPQVQQYMNSELAYKNKQRTAWGLAPVDTYGNIQGSKNYGVTFGSGSSGGLPPSIRRSVMRNLRFDDKKAEAHVTSMVKKGLSAGKMPHATMPKVKLHQPKFASAKIKSSSSKVGRLMKPKNFPKVAVAKHHNVKNLFA